MQRMLLMLILGLLLSGCATTISHKLGISDLEWSNFSKEQQQKLLNSYTEISHKQEQALQAVATEPTGTYLDITIHGGQVIFPPYLEWENYTPAQTIIFHDECKNVILHKPASEVTTSLLLCFHDNTLRIDPSRYDISKQNGTVAINYSPLWLSGFEYKGISSSGFVQLNNVSIGVKQAERNNVNST